MDSSVIQQNTTTLPSRAGGSHCANAPGWPSPALLAPASFRGGGGPAGTPNPTSPLHLESPFLAVSIIHFAKLPETTAFSVLLLSLSFFKNTSLRGSGAGGGGAGRDTDRHLLLICEWRPPMAAPLVLCHAALPRLALPNFCLKLNLKEKSPKQTKKAGSLFYQIIFGYR